MTATQKRPVRTGTIVWGVMLLAFAAITFSVAVFDLREFQAPAVTWAITGLGGLLVLAAIVLLIVRTATRAGEAPETPDQHQPVD